MPIARSGPARRIRLLAVLIGLITVCSACRVDVDVSVAVNNDGSGTIVVAAEADADVVQQAPNLAADLRFDDAVAAGWVVTPPTATGTGGLQVSLSHEFKSTAEATQILASISGADGPLRGIIVGRQHSESLTTFSLDGSVLVSGDLSSFTDPELLAAIGAAPYASEIASRQLNVADTFSVTLHAKLPGEVVSTTGTAVDDQLAWSVPLIAPPTLVTTQTQLHERGNSWASPLAKGALIALVLWCVAATLFILYVVLARRRRTLARSRRGYRD